MEPNIPDDIMCDILRSLDGKNLKACRGVCRDWHRLATPFLSEKTTVIFDGRSNVTNVKKFLQSLIPFHPKDLSKPEKMIDYLQKSDTKFFLWDAMRLRGMTTVQAKLLSQNWSAAAAAAVAPDENSAILKSVQPLSTIYKMEIVHCSVDCLIILEFLRCFKNLRVLIDDHSVYYAPSFMTAVCRSLVQLEEIITEKHRSTSLPINTLLIQQSDLTANARVLLRMFDVTCTQLENFSLELLHERNLSNFLLRNEFCNRLGFFLLKHSSTLKKVSLRWYNHEYDMCFEDCLRVLQIMGMNADISRLEELELCFQWIFLINPDVSRVLLPFVNRLRNLKKLVIQKVVFSGASSLEILQRLKHTGATFEFEFGTLICDTALGDGPGALQESIQVHREMLQNEFSTSQLISLLVTFDTALIPSLEYIIPLYPLARYNKVTEMGVSCRRFEAQSTDVVFGNFNVPLIAATFPNLTELRIFDGPPLPNRNPVIYSYSQYAHMSAATISNSDVQALISELPKLRKIRIRARLLLLTDTGLTGLSPETCERMGTEKSYRIINPNEELIGLPLSQLKSLTEFSLQGLAIGITNVSAFHAFGGCKGLKELVLFGRPRITKSGREHLRLLAKNQGFTLSINF